MTDTEELQSGELRSDKMRNKKIGKLLLEMSLPAIISMLVQSLYNIVDSIFVSNTTKTFASYAGTNLGDDSFMAVSIAYPMTMLVVAIALGIGVGVNAYIARKLGEGNKQSADKAAKAALLMCVAAWLVLLVLAFTLSKPFVRAFVSEDNVTDAAYVTEQGALYLTLYFALSLGGIVEVACERILQSTGNMKMPMLSQLLGAVVNIVLDAVFILGCGWGVLGAIVATVIGQWCAGVFALSVLVFKKQDVSVSFKGYRPEKEYFFYILKMGTPAFVMNAMSSFITIILNTMLREGTGIFVLSAYFKVQSFVFMPVFGLMQGAVPIMSYNYGANLKERYNQTFKRTLLVSLAIMAVGTALFLALPEQIMRILTSDAKTIEDGAYAFRVISIAFIPAAFSIVIINMLQSINRPFSSLMMSLCRQLIVLLPSAFVLNILWGQSGIWFCYPVAEILSVLVFVPVAVSAYKKQFLYKQKQYQSGQLNAA